MTLKYLNEIVCGDSLELIEELPDNSIDLVITSPPYNLDLGNNKFHKLRYDVYDDNNTVCMHDEEDDVKDTNDEVDNEGAIMQQVFPSWV